MVPGVRSLLTQLHADIDALEKNAAPTVCVGVVYVRVCHSRIEEVTKRVHVAHLAF